MEKIKRISFTSVCLILIMCLMMTTFTGCKKSSSGDDTSSDISNESEFIESSDETDVSDTSSDEGDSPLKPSENNSSATTPSNNQSSTATPSTPTQSGSKFNPYQGIESERGKTVRIFTWWKLTEAEEKVLKDFKAKYGINYKATYVTKPLYATQVTSMIASGKNVPDLICMDHESFPNPIFKNQLQPITVGKFDIVNDKAYDLDMMNAVKWKGQYYGVQLKNNTTYQRGTIYFNETLFKERGVKTPYQYWKEGNWNWDTLAECAKKMTFTSGGKQCYGLNSDMTFFTYLMASNNTDFVKNTGTAIVNNLNDKALLETLNYISDLKIGGYWDPQEGGTKKLLNRECAMYMDGSWKMEATSSFGDGVGVAPVPSPKGKQFIQGVSASVWGIAAGSKNPAAASYMIRYWLDGDNFNMEKHIPNPQHREVFNAMNNASKRAVNIAHGVTTYIDSENFWYLLSIGTLPKNDIPVALKERSAMLDGIIKQIMQDAK